MNRNILLIPVAILIFLGVEFLSNDEADADIGSSPRAVQYRENIGKFAFVGGGSISEACSASLKHTVLVTCLVRGVNLLVIQNSLSREGWQKIADSEPKTTKYKKGNDVLTIQHADGPFVVSLSLRAEK